MFGGFGGNLPAPAFPGGETGKGSSDSLRRRLFLSRHAEILHPSALPRLRHMAATRPLLFGLDLSLVRLRAGRQHYEVLADACLQRSIQSRLDPDRGSAPPRHHRRLRYLPLLSIPCHRIVVRHLPLFHMAQYAFQRKRLCHGSMGIHSAGWLYRKSFVPFLEKLLFQVPVRILQRRHSGSP